MQRWHKRRTKKMAQSQPGEPEESESESESESENRQGRHVCSFLDVTHDLSRVPAECSDQQYLIYQSSGRPDIN